MSRIEPDVIQMWALAARSKTSIMGVGFIGRRYCDLYPNEATPENREVVAPTESDVLWLRSTTDNYAPKRGDLEVDVMTNQLLTMQTLPLTRGVFNAVSSWFVWGSAAGLTANTPARETDPCDPNGFYSISKLAMEKMVRSYCQMEDKSYRILRLCNVIGNDPHAGKTKNALEMMLRRVVKGEDVDLYTGSCYRNVLHVDDACRALHLCITKGDLNTIINIGAPRSVRMIDLIEHAKGVTGSKSRINLVSPPRFHQIVQVPDFWLDTTRLCGLGFIPDMDPYQAVERVLANMT